MTIDGLLWRTIHLPGSEWSKLMIGGLPELELFLARLGGLDRPALLLPPFRG